MKLDDVLSLRPGDAVFWNDPDAGLCSRAIIVHMIDVRPDRVEIVDPDGDVLECYPEHLSAV